MTVCVLAVASVSFAQQRSAQSFDSNGVQISYVDSGRGVPVVLLHGFTGSYSRHWEGPGVMKALETAGYRVIAMDCRGHGQSGKPRDSGQYGLEMVRDVVRLLDRLNIERAHIVGYSMGGAIASQLLVKYSKRVLTVTLLGSGWEGEDLKALTSQMLAMADGFDHKDANALIRGVSASGQSGPTDAEVAAATADLFARNDPQVLAAIARGLPPLWQISRDDLRTTTVPVLAIIGEYDRNNLEAVRRMAGVVSGLQVVQLPGASHATSVRPAAEHIVAFLNNHRRN
jgi:pimeloyl-ACP methyl ester carboxylesterase